jgi:multicomponent Na+:H+ antiporter subunit D
VAIYLLLRFFFTIFGVHFSFDVMPLGEVLAVLSVIAMFSASVVAVFQQNIKRLLAYSSVAQVGYITLGISMGTVTGVAAGIVHLFNHALIKGALFLALGSLVYRVGTTRLDDIQGIGRNMPWTMGAFVVGGLSLIGVPLTTGFISKWNLVQAALEIGWWPIAVAILATSLLAVVYVWRVVERAFFQVPTGAASGATEAPLSLLLPTWLLALANIYFGADATLSWGLAFRAAQGLLGVTQ